MANSEQRKKYEMTVKGRARKLENASFERALKYGIPHDLNTAWIIEQWERQGGKCALTGIPFVLERDPKWHTHPFAPSLDRIVPHLGYTKENVRLVCCSVNLALNEWGEEIFAQIARAYLDTKEQATGT